MIKKLFLSIPLIAVCCLLLSVKAFALGNSDIEILVSSPIDSLASESGVVATEKFPAEIPVQITAKTGTLTDIKLEYNGESRTIPPEYILIVESKEQCGPYTITAKTDQGAILTITVNVVFQVKAIFDVRYRTISMNVKEIYEDEKLLKSFQEPQRINLIGANTVADHEKEQIAEWIDRHDGGTYTLKGSLVVEIYSFSTGKVFGVYDTDEDFNPLTTRFGWTPKALIAFETMGNTALTYQAPVKIDVTATWCDENKQEIFGKLTAQDKGVPQLLYPYQTAAVRFTKDDISLSRNYKYIGMEWIYTPASTEYADGENKTQTSITQKIHYKIPSAAFYFKFEACKGNDLSVVIRAPATVNRGDDYSFTILYMNSGNSPAYDVSQKGTVDDIAIKEIPTVQDFTANSSKTYVVERAADVTADEIHLWADIGVPEGFIDANLANNTATAIIRIVDPEPEPAPDSTYDPDDPDNPDNPDSPNDPDNPENPPDKPTEKKELCDLSASIFTPPTAYEHEDYQYTIIFTNHSGKELIDVFLQGKNNENTLSQIPKTVDFRPHETKSFVVTGTAGNAGEVYQLWANITEPEGFTDENPINNTAVSSIKVVERPADNPNDPDNPDDPDDPNNPDDPDNPEKKLCDVWTNLSCPPIVYEQEEYAVTVYFANSTNKALSDVNLNLTIDGKAVSVVPSTANFKAYEIKTYLVKGTAGQKGTNIHLSARVSPPAGYTDTNTINNQATVKITVMARPYDLDVQRITPDRYKENQTVITTVKVSNTGSLDFAPGQKVSVLFEIPELAVKKRVDAIIMQQDTWNTISVKWDTPNVQADKPITLTATINPDGTLDNETSTANNVFTQKAIIQNVDYGEPEESRSLPNPPQRSDQPKVTWWEQRFENGQFVWRQFYAELHVSAVLNYDTKAKGYLKSGYGYSIQANATVKTNYDRPELITAAQTAEVYLPEYRYITAIPLDKVDGQFVFRENPASPFLYRKQYVPIWFPDKKDYVMQLLVTDVHTPGGTLSKWITGGDLKIYVVDSMYDDDATTGN